MKRLAERRADRVRAEIQDELVAIIEQGRTLNKNAFDEPGYGPFKIWQEKTVRFIETVLGPLEAQRFCETYEPPPHAFSETVEYRLRRLAALRDRPETWKPQVASSALRAACELRRHVSDAELVVLAGDPGGAAQVPKRLDRTALGVDLNDLAASFDVVIEDRRRSEELGITAAEERARLSALALPREVVRKLAESTVGAETRDLPSRAWRKAQRSHRRVHRTRRSRPFRTQAVRRT